MNRFADSNILCRYIEVSHADHAAARDVIATIIARNESLLISPQIEREFWAVATRPTNAPRGGLGMTPQEAQQRLRALRAFLHFVPDSAAVHEAWRRLVTAHSISGVRAHDAAIAGAAIVCGANEILTFNKDDFEKFKDEISVKTPHELLLEFQAQRQSEQK